MKTRKKRRLAARVQALLVEAERAAALVLDEAGIAREAVQRAFPKEKRKGRGSRPQAV